MALAMTQMSVQTPMSVIDVKGRSRCAASTARISRVEPKVGFSKAVAFCIFSARAMVSFKAQPSLPLTQWTTGR